MLLGLRLPYRNIIKTDPYDDAFGLPLVYCHFTCKRHLPYESVEVYREIQGGFAHLEEVEFKNRLTLHEVAELPGRLRGELAQRRFEKDIAEQKRQLQEGSS
jgi:hypothetical protein